MFDPNAKYFVVSDGKDPIQMFFDLKPAKSAAVSYAAETAGTYYINIFNEYGIPISSIKMIGRNEWTSEF